MPPFFYSEGPLKFIPDKSRDLLFVQAPTVSSGVQLVEQDLGKIGRP